MAAEAVLQVRLVFKHAVVLEWGASEQVTVRGPLGARTLNAVTPGMRAVLEQLAGAGAEEQGLAAAITQHDGAAQLAALYFQLARLDALAMIDRKAVLSGETILTLEPSARGFRFTEQHIPPAKRFILSRFAYLHRDGGDLLLESPLGRARCRLHGGQGAALVTLLSTAHSLDELERGFGHREPGASGGAAESLLGLLLNAGAATEVQESGEPAEEQHIALRQWEFHDLLFHARSRLGRHDYPFGGTYRFAETIPPLPAIEPPAAATEMAVELPRPDLDALIASDVPFTRVVETRRSNRDHDDAPLTLRQLGEFLYRSARARRIVETDHGQLAFYLYPSGGASSELTLYLAIDRCEGLPPGLYQYAADAHVLYPVPQRSPAVEVLLALAARTAQLERAPQVLIVLAARLPRVAWKYESMAYALILKHVGVLYSQFYLVATAMGLAGCALGGGDSDLFAQAANLDYYTESAVGEFILGRARATGRQAELIPA